jgi:hypothetical protein
MIIGEGLNAVMLEETPVRARHRTTVPRLSGPEPSHYTD